MERVRGTGRTIFGGVLLATGGMLNGMYGIAALRNSCFFVGDARYVFGGLHTWG